MRHALGLVLLGGGVPLGDELLGQRELLVLASLELGAGHDHVELGALGREDLRLERGLVQDDLVRVRVRVRVRARARVRVRVRARVRVGVRARVRVRVRVRISVLREASFSEGCVMGG